MDNEEYAKISERIKLLSKMTVKNGCTPQEEATAYELADELRNKLAGGKLKESRQTARLSIEAWKKLQRKWFKELQMDQHIGNYAVEPDGGMVRIWRKDE